ncbi:MAG: hypothetical protein Q7S55_04035 [Nanoarchaeota archaeon]|nr:hypothetical protein [Nanoarchaeota archaeon]
MGQKTWLSSTTFSLAALLTSGCASRPYTQIQVAYANTRHDKDLGGHINLLCVRARGGATVGAKGPSEREISERRDLLIRKIKNSTNYYFQKNPDDPRKQGWDAFLGSEKAGQKIVLNQECDGTLYFGLDGISQVPDPTPRESTNDVLDLSERVPNYTVPLAPGAAPEKKHYAFGGLPYLLDQHKKCSSTRRSEFRLGADICYGKLPDSNSKRKYSVDVPIVGEKEADVQGETSSTLVKLAIPFLEYRYFGLEANLPGDDAANIGLRSPEAKDISLGLWASGGYVMDFAISETDYSTSGGSVDNVPGVDIEGSFYGELTNEVTLFGRVPVSMSVRVDEDKNITPLFSAGYRIQW